MIDPKFYKEALLIRRIEETFLKLFSDGKINGTVHTCIGQEFSAVSIANQLQEGDFIFSNHRCHGHYISFTKDFKGLLLELVGKREGVCGGIGGSQHLCNKDFYSNGIQGGIVPVAAGLALARKLDKKNSIGVVFIGDGTLGEGIVYETLNIISKWEIPLLVVCENNQYAQSTKITHTLAGTIISRAESFGIQSFNSSTENVDDLMAVAKDSIDFVRERKAPAFLLIDTYRLNAHSKGDDDRDAAEVDYYKSKDPLNKFELSNPILYSEYLTEINNEINSIVERLDEFHEPTLADYLGEVKMYDEKVQWTELETINERLVTLINSFFIEQMRKDSKLIFVGEDVLSPYGGAFKVAKELSAKYPNQVLSTPISEASIVGISNGLALGGFRPFTEIMFGDFITLTMDQLINHASKFYHMYNKKIKCPIVIRTPMGGGRGYGPTHSQTLDKFVIGIDNLKVIALNVLISPKAIYESVASENHPVLVVENKLDYGKFIARHRIKNYETLRTISKYPVVKFKPKVAKSHFTIVTYGGMASNVIEAVEKLFFECELLGEILILSCIHPIIECDFLEIFSSSEKTKFLFVVEEGSSFSGWGSEIVSKVSDTSNTKITTCRISSLQVPIPSSSSLEKHILVGADSIFQVVKNKLKG